MNGDTWFELLLAWMHDPPDKALDIRGHEGRARQYASAAAGLPVESVKLSADARAAVVERLPMPRAQALAVEYDGHVCHPLSGDRILAPAPPLDPARVESEIRHLLQGVADGAPRALTTWRLLPERLATVHPSYERLPADTRLPDHTIWHHLDATAAFRGAEGPDGAALLSFTIGPVQTFIAAARSVRDLWSGSWILSWLAFSAMEPLLDRLGPTALVFPALRGIPLMDEWLHRRGIPVSRPGNAALSSPCLPNRFLALVPAGSTADSLARAAGEAAHCAWRDLAASVRDRLRRDLGEGWSGWDARWDEQVEGYFDICASVLPLRGARYETIVGLLAGPDGEAPFGNVENLRRLAEAIPHSDRPGYTQNNVGQWAAQVAFAARLHEARRSVRKVPAGAGGDGPFAPKCGLTGSHEQMGPAGLKESAVFWEAAREKWRLRARERFGAVALVRRYAPEVLRKRFDVRLRTPDTATIAAMDWLHQPEVGIHWQGDEWSGQWLHWPNPQSDTGEPGPDAAVWERIVSARRKNAPPAYFAVLAMDGDGMGEWLRGTRLPEVGKVLHPAAKAYFERHGAGALLAARRPLGPAMHAAFSAALAGFASRCAPRIVADHRGVLVYAGGDDVLALLPALRGAPCAAALMRAFQEELGRTATMSAGLAVVHYKEDLREALQIARDAEAAAKRSGKNALTIAACRRSGEHAQAPLSWDYLPTFLSWVDRFRENASDRWAFHLRRALGALRTLPIAAIEAEIARQVSRGEDVTRSAFAAAAADFARYARGRADSLADWIALVQSASFLARGRER